MARADVAPIGHARGRHAKLLANRHRPPKLKHEPSLVPTMREELPTCLNETSCGREMQTSCHGSVEIPWRDDAPQGGRYAFTRSHWSSR